MLYIYSFGKKNKILECFDRNNNTFYSKNSFCDILKKILKNIINIYPIYDGIQGALIPNNSTNKLEPYIRDIVKYSELNKIENKKVIIIKEIENDYIECYIPCNNYKYNNKYNWIIELFNNSFQELVLKYSNIQMAGSDVIYTSDQIHLIGHNSHINNNLYNNITYDSCLDFFKTYPNIIELILHTNIGFLKIDKSGFQELANINHEKN